MNIYILHTQVQRGPHFSAPKAALQAHVAREKEKVLEKKDEGKDSKLARSDAQSGSLSPISSFKRRDLGLSNGGSSASHSRSQGVSAPSAASGSDMAPASLSPIQPSPEFKAVESSSRDDVVTATDGAPSAAHSGEPNGILALGDMQDAHGSTELPGADGVEGSADVGVDGGSLFGVKLKKVARDAPPPLADNASGQLQPAALPASGLALEATRPEAPIAVPEGLQAIERTGDAVVDGQMPPDSLQDDLLEQFGLAAAPMAPALGGTQGVQRDADKVSDDESVGDAGDVQANLQVPLARLTCLVHRNEHWLV